MATKQFPGLITILQESLAIFKHSWKKIILMSLLPYVAGASFGGLFVIFAGTYAVTKSWLVVIPLAIIVLIALVYIFTWLSSAMIVLIQHIDEDDQNFSIKEAIKKARPTVGPLWLTQLLGGLIVIGGILLFIIPGIIFSLWFVMAFYVVILEKQKGLRALAMSREYMRGYTGVVVIYSIILAILYMLITSVPGMLFEVMELESLKGIYQLIVQFLLSPISIIVSYKLYKALRITKGDITSKVNSVNYGRYKAGVIWGLVGPVLLMILMFSTLAKMFNYYNMMNDYQNTPAPQYYEKDTVPIDGVI